MLEGGAEESNEGVTEIVAVSVPDQLALPDVEADGKADMVALQVEVRVVDRLPEHVDVKEADSETEGEIENEDVAV
jgi:hypothetical protein